MKEVLLKKSSFLSLPKEYLGFALAIIAMISAGFTAIPFSLALETISPLTVVYGMFFWAFIFTLPGIWIQRLPLFFDRKHGLALVIFAILGVLGNYAICEALLGVSPTVAVVVQRGEIIIAMLLGWIILKERIGLRLWIGLALAIAGILLIRKDVFEVSWDAWGPIIWAIISAASFATIQIITKFIVHQINPQVINLWRLAIALIILTFIPGVFGQIQQAGSQEWMWMMTAAFAGPFFARIVYTYSLKYIPVSKAVLMTTFAPISTLVFEFLLLGNLITWYEAAGGGLILTGVLWSLMPQKNNNNK